LVGEETEPPYERPPLSKGYLTGSEPREKAFLHDEQWWADHDIDLRLGRRATMLDPAAHTVTLDGYEELRYDKLLLATGSRVRTLNVPGHDLSDVRYLRTIDAADALRARLSGGATRVVVVGAGWIGLEVAAAARGYGAQVTVVELDQLPLRRVLGDEVATLYRDLHVAHGVEFRFGAGVREFAAEGGRLRAVVLTDGSELPADLAVVGIGITPNTELAVAAGLTVEDGIVTDASLPTSDPDIYACGDVACTPQTALAVAAGLPVADGIVADASLRTSDPDICACGGVACTPNTVAGRRIRVEHWSNALNGGPAAARAMLGQDVTFDRVAYFY